MLERFILELSWPPNLITSGIEYHDSRMQMMGIEIVNKLFGPGTVNINVVIGGILILHFLGIAVVYAMWQRVKDKPDFREKLQ